MSKEKIKYKFFGRLKGRKKNILLKNNSRKYLFDIKDLDVNNYNILDIGSGSGENSIALSSKKPQSQIIACDIFKDGNINLLNTIYDNKIKNISLFQGNVLELLDTISIKEYFNEVWILFPDPWPKKRHNKRRLINYEFLINLRSYLKKESKIFIGTDSDVYLLSILNNLYDLKDSFYWENKRFLEWSYEFCNLPKTKFYKKAKKLNKNSFFIQLKKI